MSITPGDNFGAMGNAEPLGSRIAATKPDFRLPDGRPEVGNESRVLHRTMRTKLTPSQRSRIHLSPNLHIMLKITSSTFCVAFCLFIVSCERATPESYFDQAVLNTNLMHGFAGSGLRRKLESPSVKLSETGTGETVTMKRKEVIDNDITSLEANFEKVQNLSETDDTRDILRASIALYDYVLPVYKTEYQQLARLYDEGAPRKQIDSLAHGIETKYGPGFVTLSNRLTSEGKAFAKRHGIKVNWGVSAEPSP